MPETAVTAPPIGASRSEDWYMNPDGSGMQQALVRGQILGAIDPSLISSNADATGAGMVLTAPYLLNPVRVDGKWVRMAKAQGSMVFGPGVPLITIQPTARSLGYPLGRYVWEGVFYYSAAATAIVDSGLLLSAVQNARILGSAANAGIGLGMRAGVLSFYSRGPGGFDLVDVSALAAPLTSLNKLTLVYRHPGQGRDATVTALVNDRIAVVRTWAAGHKLPLAGAGATLMYPQVTHATVTVDAWAMDLRYSAGPDVVDL